MVCFLAIIVLLCSIGIVYSDFKTRLISVWLIAGFMISNACLYIIRNSLQLLSENFIFTVVYLLFCYMVLHLYYFFKGGGFANLLGEKFGLGDCLVILAVGATLEPEILIYFLTASFLISLLAQLSLFKAQKTIPLAGHLVICYV